MKKLFFLCLLPTISVAQLSIEDCSNIKDAEESGKCYSQLLNTNPPMEERLIIKEKIDEINKKLEDQLHSWNYLEKKDKMRGTSSFIASIASRNNIKLSSSRRDEMLVLGVRKRANANEVLFVLTQGLFNCVGNGCNIAVKFDDGDIESYRAVESSNGSSDTLFMLGDKSVKSFASKLKQAKNLIIEVPIYSYGNAQFEFNIEGLNWKHF